MSTRSKRRRSRSTRKPSLVLIAIGVGLAAALVAIVWLVRVGRLDRGPQAADLGEQLRTLATVHGCGPAEVVADAPIRKVEGVFVRSWWITLPSAEALASLRTEIEGEVARRHGRVAEAQAGAAGEVRLRIDLGVEAFDLRLTTRRRLAERRPAPSPTPKPSPTPRPEPPPGARGRLAIILDDGGQSLDLVTAAAALPTAVAVSVLPFLPFSSETAAEIHRSGHEVWLHLPMEPEDRSANPGPGVVLTTMSASEIRATVHAALNSVPFAVGVNNHMGSRASADLRTMTWVMQELKARGVAFVDSRTTTRTVAEEAARAQGVVTGRRHVFLDNQRDRTAIRRQLAEAVYRCRTRGDTLAIGHLVAPTVELLEEELPRLTGRGADLVPPLELLR